MTRYAVVIGGIVDNVTDAVSDLVVPPNWIASQIAQMGDRYDVSTGQFTRPPAPQPEIPRSVTRRQGKRALDEMGFLDAVEATVAAAPRAVQIDWADAGTFDRDSAVVTALAASLPLTEKQLDDLFTLAATFQ